MNPHAMTDAVGKPEAADSKPTSNGVRSTRAPGKPRPGPAAMALARSGTEAKRVGAAILDVLGGERTPAEAAVALGVSQPRYYALESRALLGLVAACEPRPSGRGANPETERTALRARVRSLERDCARYQALARASQRAIGLSMPPTPAASGRAKGKRRRRPAIRALRAARALAAPSPEASGDVAGAPPSGGPTTTTPSGSGT
jgi:hypothetical protein